MQWIERASRREFLVAASAGVAACGRKKGTRFPGYAFVANAGGNAIAVVDLSTFTLARHIRLKHSPSQVLATGIPGQVFALTPVAGALVELDATRLAAGRTVRIGGRLERMRLAPDGQSVWVLCAEPGRLVCVDARSAKVVSSVDLASTPTAFDVAPVGAIAAVALPEASALAWVGLTTGRVKRVEVESGEWRQLQFRTDGRYLLAGDRIRRRISVFRAGTGEPVVHLPLAMSPDHWCMKADGGQLFVAGDGSDAIALAYPYTTELGGTLLAGKSPRAMATAVNRYPEFDYLFIANPGQGTVSILSLSAQRVIAVAQVGADPGYIVLTPDNSYALVLNRGSGDMAVLRVKPIPGRKMRVAPVLTMIPLGSNPVSAAVVRV